MFKSLTKEEVAGLSPELTRAAIALDILKKFEDSRTAQHNRLALLVYLRRTLEIVGVPTQEDVSRVPETEMGKGYLSAMDAYIQNRIKGIWKTDDGAGYRELHEFLKENELPEYAFFAAQVSQRLKKLGLYE